MKRVRDRAIIDAEFFEVEQEINRLEKRRRLLVDERNAHPEVVSEQARRQRHRLERRLPWQLHERLLDRDNPIYGKLTALSIDYGADESFSESDEDVPSTWTCDVQFSRVAFSQYNVKMSQDRVTAIGFSWVDYDPDPVVMWENALIANNDDMNNALAAFSFACCEFIGDYNAEPADAFPVEKNKNEVTDE